MKIGDVCKREREAEKGMEKIGKVEFSAGHRERERAREVGRYTDSTSG